MKTKWKIVIAVLAVVLALGVAAAAIMLCEKTPVENLSGGGEEVIAQYDELYPCSDEYVKYLGAPQKLMAGAVFYYRTPTERTNGPLEQYACLSSQDFEELFNTLKEQKWVNDALVDRTEFIFDGQVYYRGWLYFSLEQKIAYYDGYFCTMPNSVVEKLKEYKERYAEKYEGTYKAGEDINTKFVSGTVVKDYYEEYGRDVLVLELFDTEPLSRNVAWIEFSFGAVGAYPQIKEGDKITVEFIGAVEAWGNGRIPQTIGYYEYDKNFEYTPVPAEHIAYSTTFDGKTEGVMRFASLSEFKSRYGEKVLKYFSQLTEKFFEEYYIFTNGILGSGSDNYAVDNVYKDGDTLKVLVYDANIGDQRTLDIAYHTVAVAVKKAAVSECTNYKFINGGIEKIYAIGVNSNKDE